jgi:hypothetical protein
VRSLGLMNARAFFPDVDDCADDEVAISEVCL